MSTSHVLFVINYIEKLNRIKSLDCLISSDLYSKLEDEFEEWCHECIESQDIDLELVRKLEYYLK